MNRNVIYRYEWRGIKTGWDYRLEFTPPDTLDLNNPTIINLPKGCVNINKFSAKFEKYPIGMPTIPALELEFNLNRIDSADFKELLFNPIIEIVIPLLFKIQSPILVNLYIKYNGNDTNDPVPYRLLFTGGIRETTFESEDSKSIVKTSAIDINKLICDNSDFVHTGLYYNDEEKVLSTAYYDMAYKYDNKSRAFFHGWPLASNRKLDYRFHSVKLDNFISGTEGIAQTVYRKILRKSDAVYSFEVNLPRLYKQRLDGSGEKGTQLNNSEIYVIGFFEKKEGNDYISVDGLFGNTETSLMNKFPNSMWDFLTELPENLLLKAHLTPTGMFMKHVFGVIAGAKQQVSVNTKRLLNYKLLIRQNILKTATASLHESRSGDRISDNKKYDATDKGSRNSDEFAAPVYLNNMPTAIDYEIYEVPHTSNYFFYTPNPRVTTLVYMENISSVIPSETGTRPLRVHHFVDFPLGNGAYSSSLPNCSENILNYSNYMAKADRFTLPMFIQDRSLPKLLANAILGLWSGSEQAVLELETRFDLHTEFLPGGSIGFPWWRFDAEFTIPSNTISEHYPTALDTYDMLESELDFNTETAKVKLLLRTV
jgi:hypothetical protein